MTTEISPKPETSQQLAELCGLCGKAPGTGRWGLCSTCRRRLAAKQHGKDLRRSRINSKPRHDKEYADEVLKPLAQDAKERQATAIKARDEKGRAKPLTQKIGEVDGDGTSRHGKETLAVIAKAAGTNRTSTQ